MLIILVAHHAEAAPLIRHYQLQPIEEEKVGVHYKGDDIYLIITGQGRKNAFAATEWAMTHLDEGKTANWLNFGIAGSGAFDLGELVVAKSIVGPNLREKVDLDQAELFPLTSAVVETVDEPETKYPHHVVYEMELSGIIEAFLDCTKHRRLFGVKLITDTPQYSLEKLTMKKIKLTIRSSEPQLFHLIDQLLISECE